MIDFLSQNVQMAFGLGVLFGMLLMWAIEEDLGNHRKGARA
ncbi:hypothetical protein [Thermococcus sp.]|nr:hypothetical protein [Thermococcus sp.]